MVVSLLKCECWRAMAAFSEGDAVMFDTLVRVLQGPLACATPTDADEEKFVQVDCDMQKLCTWTANVHTGADLFVRVLLPPREC